MEELEMGEEELAFYGGAAFDCGIDGSALSFVDLLGFHDSVFDFPPPPLPANSPSPSSSSTASAAELLACEEVDGKIATDINNGDRDGEKGRKGGKKGQKRQKQPRFAFMTKSEVDHLEDGYRWRKYGQKAVKNSPYARSYYRCTSPSCGVKKRVERSCDDPSVVVTTYEGQHIHPSPIGARGNPPATAFHQNSPFPIHHNQLHQQHQHQHQHQQFMLLQQQHQQALHQHAFQLHLPPPPSPMVHFESIGFATGQPATTPSSAAIKDCGLLQDMVPSDIYDSHKE